VAEKSGGTLHQSSAAITPGSRFTARATERKVRAVFKQSGQSTVHSSPTAVFA